MNNSVAGPVEPAATIYETWIGSRLRIRKRRNRG